MLSLKAAAAKYRNKEFTPAQVGALFAMQNAEVNNLIDEIVPTGAAMAGGGRRFVQYKGLVPLLLARDFITWGLKKDLRQQALLRALKPLRTNLNVPGTTLSVLVASHKAQVAKAVQSLCDAESAVVSKAEIMQGEPCIRGTRISAYVVADIVEDAGIDAAKRTYPQLSKRQVELAHLFAKASPRRGRPKEIKVPTKKANKRSVTTV